jgi:hypothetical protein
MKSKFNYEKYRLMTMKQIKENIEKKSIKDLTLEDVFMYECLTKPAYIKLMRGKKK